MKPLATISLHLKAWKLGIKFRQAVEMKAAGIITKQIFMKKIIGFGSIAVASILFACSNQPAETKKEVIVVPDTKEVPVPVVKEKVVVQDTDRPTSISVDKKGVKVESKKVNVDIKPNQ